MQLATPHLTPQQWMFALFSDRAARNCGVLHRSVRDVERLIGRKAFVAEMRRRGFRVLENGGQFIIICNREPLKRIV